MKIERTYMMSWMNFCRILWRRNKDMEIRNSKTFQTMQQREERQLDQRLTRKRERKTKRRKMQVVGQVKGTWRMKEPYLRLHSSTNSALACKCCSPLIIINDSYEDSDSSEDEGLPDYKIGGYHPMHVG